MNAYFISGLGADHLAFKKIVLPPQYEIKHIAWKRPHPKESFRNYCIRLTSGIDKSENFVLLGLSFGGIVVSEVMSILNPKKAIIFSSISSMRQLPWYFKLLGMIQIQKLIPVQWLKR